MVKLQRGYIIITTILSTLACLCSILSVATNEWLNAVAVLTTRLESDINYGLFAGRLERKQLAAKLPFQLKVVCDFSEGVCMYSCQRDAAARQSELDRILAGEPLTPCEQAEKRWNMKANNENRTGLKADFFNTTDFNAADSCMPAAWWLCTVLASSCTIVFALCACAFSLLNVYSTPIEQICHIFGLYIWNGAAAAFALLTLLLWTALFQLHLRHNAAITDTLRAEFRFSSVERTRMGSSCFIMGGTLLLSLLNMGTLWLRGFHIKRVNSPRTTKLKENDVPLQFY